METVMENHQISMTLVVEKEKKSMHQNVKISSPSLRMKQ